MNVLVRDAKERDGMPKKGMGSFVKMPSLQNFADFLMKFPEIQTSEQMRHGRDH